MKYRIESLKYDGKEKKGFIIDRSQGTDDYLFLHFKTPVNIYQQNEIIKIKPGACILFTPGTKHYFESNECDLVHNWIHFEPEKGSRFDEFGFDYNRVFYPSRTNYITPIISEIELDFINKPFLWEENASALLTNLFIKLSREERSKTRDLSNGMIEIREEFNIFRLHLYSNCSQEWNVEKMAKKLRLSRSRFSVLYKTIFGVSPNEDLITARINRGKYLLENSSLTIYEVAEMSGYNNVFHFIRQFKKYTGTTPGMFRGF
ncbi:AraC family transcriptional regulator [Vallitalea sediminicola]